LGGNDWKVLKSHISPKNSQIHKENRGKFCQQYQNESFGGEGDTTFLVDIDEKNFYSFQHKIAYVPKEMLEKFQYIHLDSKTNIESVMFFGAIARPCPKYNFDGKCCSCQSVKRKYEKERENMGRKETLSL
jgi:hypothetical protein